MPGTPSTPHLTSGRGWHPFFTGYSTAFRDQNNDLYFWVPIVGPILGGLGGAGLYQMLIGRFLPREEPPEPGRVPIPTQETVRAGQ
ncbi:hypothetical protein GCM10022251_60660 [Phytohabitans flavus]|uniref:Uncharacterized protein n=1 Tax=Phytohabitans flavus TaxID=1076124 RepID=A0A6F8Y4J8_9ACTN|nr:hypothetical protein Pflav_073630 [Phytohabitans flavus]